MNYEIKFPKDYTKPKLPGRDKWIEALRSGKYEQGKGKLCKNGNYCCLGVLCEIQGRPKFNGGRDARVCFDSSKGHLSAENPVYNKLNASGFFPEGIKVEFKNGKYGSLADCNDHGLTFDQIADIIEAIWDNE
jgi:hypothetical protein